MITDRDLQEMSVLERQQAVLNWQQGQLFQHQHPLHYSYTNANDQMCMFNTQAQVHPFPGFIDTDQGLDELVSQAAKQGPGWGDHGNMSSTIPRTISCPPAVAAAMEEAVAATSKGKEMTMPETPSSAVGRESSRKRRVDKTRSQKVNTEEEPEDKKMKASGQEGGDSKITEQHSSNKNTTSSNSNKDHSAHTSKENSKVTEVQKPDYIHVRARRGQATDSHSLAERVRREKISERMKYLQDLVPGCSKIVGKAGMLDEIINYVQSLQKQVEFLSMKLAAVNPTIDFNTDSIFAKEIISAGTSNFSTFGLPSEMANPVQLQFNPLQQIASCSGIETVINPPDMALRRTISAPVTIPETLLDQSCFNQIQHSTCDTDLQNLYAMEFQQGKSASFFSHPFAGYVEAGHVKLQM